MIFKSGVLTGRDIVTLKIKHFKVFLSIPYFDVSSSLAYFLKFGGGYKLFRKRRHLNPSVKSLTYTPRIKDDRMEKYGAYIVFISK